MKRTFALAFAALLTAQLALAGAKAKPEPKKPMPKISPKIELTLDGDAETTLKALKAWFGMEDKEEKKEEKPEHIEIIVTQAKSVGTANDDVARNRRPRRSRKSPSCPPTCPSATSRGLIRTRRSCARRPATAFGR